VLVPEEVVRLCARAVVRGAVIASFVALGVLPGAASAARHYEMVSPLDKGQGDIVGDGATTVASRFGDAVAFNSRTPFGDTVGSGGIGQTQYVARRSDEGWTTRAITPTPRPDAQQTFFVGTRVQIYSEDLRTAVVRAYDLPAVTTDPPLRNNIYVEDTTTRQLETVTVSQADPPDVADFINYPTLGFWGISADARHVAFVTPTRFLPDAAPGAPNVYQWDNGVLSLAGILPDGTVPAGGSDMVPASYRAAMSANGARLLFTASAGGNPQLYMRIGGTRTVWISESELDPSDPNYQQDPVGVRLKAMTPDGHTVFFTADTPLLRDAPGGSLYRYTDSDDPSRDSNLTLISGGAEVVGMSDDGERVYTQNAVDQLAVWDHGTTRLISGAVTQQTSTGDRLDVMGFAPGSARVTPDGNYLAFLIGSGSSQDLLGNPMNGHREMYLYSLRDDTLTCVSCPSGPATSDATVLPAATEGRITIENAAFRPRFLSDDGKVFFSTAEGLLPQDRNGVLDTYEYDPTSDTLSLLSTGKGSDPSTFADASASGNDVFLVTRQRLVASDGDDLVDVYDARDGSSLPTPAEQGPPPCQGDACKPPPSASPLADLFGTSTFDQSGTGAPRHSGLVVPRHVTLRGASGLLRVRLSAAGTLAWSGRGLRRGAIRPKSGGTYQVRLRLARRARMHLRTSGVYTTAVHLTFMSRSGDTVKRTAHVTFRAVAKKGR
jgi:hypothetical protein